MVGRNRADIATISSTMDDKLAVHLAEARKLAERKAEESPVGKKSVTIRDDIDPS